MHYAFKIGIDINIKFWLMWLIRKGFNHSLINYELLITYKSWMHFVQTLKMHETITAVPYDGKGSGSTPQLF